MKKKKIMFIQLACIIVYACISIWLAQLLMDWAKLAPTKNSEIGRLVVGFGLIISPFFFLGVDYTRQEHE